MSATSTSTSTSTSKVEQGQEARGTQTQTQTKTITLTAEQLEEIKKRQVSVHAGLILQFIGLLNICSQRNLFGITEYSEIGALNDSLVSIWESVINRGVSTGQHSAAQKDAAPHLDGSPRGVE